MHFYLSLKKICTEKHPLFNLWDLSFQRSEWMPAYPSPLNGNSNLNVADVHTSMNTPSPPISARRRIHFPWLTNNQENIQLVRHASVISAQSGITDVLLIAHTHTHLILRASRGCISSSIKA